MLHHSHFPITELETDVCNVFHVGGLVRDPNVPRDYRWAHRSKHGANLNLKEAVRFEAVLSLRFLMTQEFRPTVRQATETALFGTSAAHHLRAKVAPC